MTKKGEEIAAQVTRAVPDIIVKVLPGQSVGLGDDNHVAGDEFQIAGPSAIALVQAGHVSIVGSVEPE
jgi:hypothetical protein